MVALADKLTAGSVDERFEWGLEILLRGLSSYIPSSPAPAARPSRARRTRKDG
jgi:hypothetical protein